MPHFPAALQIVIRRSFGDKRTALAESAKMHGTEIGRLLSEEAPLTAEKLTKILSACEDNEDRSLLVHAAVRDFVGEEEYQQRFCSYTSAPERLNEGLGGPSFHAHFPIDPRAEQVLRYLVNNVQHNADVAAALILLGKFLELPADVPETPPTEPTTQDHLRKAARQFLKDNPPDTSPPSRRTVQPPAHPQLPQPKR